ncbi:MAG: DUF885 domain-containing protein [Clostridiales bacterium]|nr:DUF885 domain-containing protein [Clostridiales bacterium]
MKYSEEIRRLCDEFYADTVENNEVYIVKWQFPNGELPDLSLERARRDSALANEVEARAREMLETHTDHNDVIMLKILIYYCGYIRKNEENWWLRFDLNHYYNMLPTFLEKLSELPVETPEQRERYRRILKNLTPFIDAQREKLEAQSRRYIRMPEEGCRLTLRSLENCAERLDALDRVEGCAADAQSVRDAMRALMDYIAGPYMALAPRAIGMCQYPGGDRLYMNEVDTYISQRLDPKLIHQRGYEELAATEADMLQVVRRMGMTGTLRECLDAIQNDPRYRFDSPEQMQKAMTGYLDQIRPYMPKYFSRMPKADCAVARLDPAAEATTSWGYYNIPVEKPIGVYYYSALELDKRCQIRTHAVVYHELLPGHHYQMNLVLEDPTLPDIIHHHYNTAFADGWAEYASGFCRELGLYSDVDELGRLSWDSFLCCRLIVDTGLNALGWTFDEAKAFLLGHTMLTDSEINTELLRYTFGMPAQALAYKWGSRFFQDLRARAERELGGAFDLKRFHDAMLAFGAIPLNILEEHFEWYLENERKAAGL